MITSVIYDDMPFFTFIEAEDVYVSNYIWPKKKYGWSKLFDLRTWKGDSSDRMILIEIYGAPAVLQGLDQVLYVLYVSSLPHSCQIDMIISVLQFRKQGLGRSNNFWRWSKSSDAGCKAPALSRVPFASASAIWSAFRILTLSGQGVNFCKKGPCFESSLSHMAELKLAYQALLGLGPSGITYQLRDCEPACWPHCASWCFITKSRTTVSALQDKIMHKR